MKKFLLGFAASDGNLDDRTVPLHPDPRDEISRWIKRHHYAHGTAFLSYIRDTFELWYQTGGIAGSEAVRIEIWCRVDDVEAVKFCLLFPEYGTMTEWIEE